MIYRAKHVNTSPYHPGEIERSFSDVDNAERWLSSFGLAKYSEHYINGENVTERLKERREAYRQKILAQKS